ncbi:MAG: O-methyltransferase [Geminicoccaceae bacterium]
MAFGWLASNDRLASYWEEVGLREHPSLRALREATRAHEHGGMASPPEQAALLAFLVEVTGARLIVEVGTFTGYGSLAMALALRPNGRLITIDVNAEWGDQGAAYWQEAGVGDRIERRLGLASEQMDALLNEGFEGLVDLIYIDADKKSYPDYLKKAEALARPGGIVALDNVFWGGEVAAPDPRSRQAQILDQINRSLAGDDRFALCVLPIGDGLTLLRKRSPDPEV